MSCFLRTRLYNENQSNGSSYRERSDGVIITFHGHLKFGALRFENLDVKMWMKSLRCSNTALNQQRTVVAEVAGTWRKEKNTRKRLGIFEIPSDSAIKLHIGQDSKNASGGLFYAVVNILGFRSSVDVNISYDGLEFHAKGKVYGMLHASAIFKSGLLSWEDQRYIASGSFENKVPESNVYHLLNTELVTLSREIFSTIQKRLELSADTIQRAKSRLSDVQILRYEWLKKVEEVKKEYNEAKDRLGLEERNLQKLFVSVKEKSEEIRLLNEELSEICEVNVCRKVCQKGRSNSTCWNHVIVKRSKMCSATCHETKKTRLKPFRVDAMCKSEQCKRIHQKHSFWGDFTSIVLLPVAPLGFYLRHKIYDSNKGHWNCKASPRKCEKQNFDYHYEYFAIPCKERCQEQFVKSSIEKPCNDVDCASFVPNITCIKENTLCTKLRKDALEKISKFKANAVSILKNLDNAQQNISLWKMKKERLSIKVQSTSTSLTMYQNAVQSLEKAYNVTMENRKRKLKILEKSLMLRKLLNELGESFVRIENITFRVKVSAGLDSKLIPINVTVTLNGTQRRVVSTVFDFTNFNRSLRSTAKEILAVYMGDVSRLSRKKRSTESKSPTNDNLQFYTFQIFHRLCLEFSIYKQTLYDVATSIYTLSANTQKLLKEDENQRENSSINISTIFEKFNVNKTKAMEMGVDVNYDSYSNVLENDPVLLEAHSFQNEVIKNSVVKSSSTLLYKNWLATMESIFETISEECSGFDDCLKYTFDRLFEITVDTGLRSANVLRLQIQEVERKFFNLTRKPDMLIDDAFHISRDILQILENMTGAEDVCAQAPNITEHPVPFTELTVNETLVLRCNATGDSLVYQWRFNSEILKNKSSNILRTNKLTERHSGNYSCDVSNHVARVTSIIALVVVGTSPSIVRHPPSRRNVILSEYDSIHCQVKKDERNITYQWWFKPFTSSSFIMLPNEKFSYLNFAPVKIGHKGWYYCKVFNKFGHTISKKSFVEVLMYSLPVPAAKVSITVISKSRASDASTFYRDILTEVLDSRFSTVSDNTRLSNERIKELNPTGCKSFAQGDERLDRIEICDWTFMLIGNNVSSMIALSGSPSEQNKNVISSVMELKNFIGRVMNETNTDGIAFALGKTNYSVQENSLEMIGMSFLCPRRQILVTEVYKCGKLFACFFYEMFFDKMVHALISSQSQRM